MDVVFQAFEGVVHQFVRMSFQAGLVLPFFRKQFAQPHMVEDVKFSLLPFDVLREAISEIFTFKNG